MKIEVQRPQLNWGPAYAEATPVWLIVGRQVIAEAFLTEGYDIKVKLPPAARIELVNGQFEVTIPNPEA